MTEPDRAVEDVFGVTAPEEEVPFVPEQGVNLLAEPEPEPVEEPEAPSDPLAAFREEEQTPDELAELRAQVSQQQAELAAANARLEERAALAEQQLLGDYEPEQQPPNYENPAVIEALTDGLDLDDDERKRLAARWNAAMQVEREIVQNSLRGELEERFAPLEDHAVEIEERSVRSEQQELARSNLATVFQEAEQVGGTEQALAEDFISRGGRSLLWQHIQDIDGNNPENVSILHNPIGLRAAVSGLAREIDRQNGASAPVSGTSTTGELPRATLPQTQPQEIDEAQEIMNAILAVDNDPLGGFARDG